MDTAFPHCFEAEIVRHDVGSTRYAYTVVFVADEVAAGLPLAERPRLRVEGEIGDVPFEASLTPVRGRWYILLSKTMLKSIGAAVGDTIPVRFTIADQDAVAVPDALRAALAEDDGARALWEAATPGKQRGLAYRVASAKTDPTRAKRIAEVFGILRGELDMRGKPIRS
ncbi:MAG: YdeI/OmpD-associated family protein [Pseudomonadota bacterium]